MFAAEELACATFLEKSGFTADDDIPDGETSEFRVAFLDRMVERVDQAVECLTCPACTEERGGNTFWFVAAEYNRSGDSFRCPRCHAFTSDGEDGTTPQPHASPKFVAWCEHAMNVMMATYARQYYTHNDLVDDMVISSCYAWPLDENMASGCEDLSADDGTDAVPAEIGVAMYVLHRHCGTKSADEEEQTETLRDARQQHQWTSSHVASVRPSLDGSAFAFQSTVMIDIVQSQHDGTNVTKSSSELQKQRVHGLVATETTKFRGRAVPLKATSRLSPTEQLGTTVVVELCEHLQRVENALRDTMESLYIGKVGSMMAQSLRVDLEQRTPASVAAPVAQMTHKDPAAVEDSAPATTAISEKKKKKSKARSAVWEAAQDDEGNTYYYNTQSGETSWDPPADDADISPPAVESSEDALGAPPEAAAESLDPLSILESLQLTQPADGYYKELKRYLRRFYGIKAFTEETLLQMDDAAYTLGEGENGDEGEVRQVLEVLIPVYGDRRKVLKWMSRRRAELEVES
jgi:hypothetical protein